MSGRQKYHWLNWFVRRVCYFSFLWSSRSECSSHARLYHPQIKAVCIGGVKSLRVAFLLAPSMLHHSWQALADGWCKLHTAERLVRRQTDRQPKYPISASVITVGSGEALLLCRMSTNTAIVSHLPQLKMKLSQEFIVSRLCDFFPPDVKPEPLDSFSGSALVCNITSLQADFQSCTDASGCLKEGNQSRLDQQEWKLWFVVNWESRCPLKKWRLSEDVTSKSQKRTRHCSFQHSESEDYTVYSLYFDNFTKCTFCSLVL